MSANFKFLTSNSSLKTLIAGVSLSLLSACAATSSEPLATRPLSALENPELPFQAQGNEPGWQLTLEEEQLKLSSAYGQKKTQFENPKFSEKNGVIYIQAQDATQHLEAQLQPTYCEDDMSGMPYPWQVRLTLTATNSQQETKPVELQGCGGDPKSLLLEEWRLEDINHQGIIGSSHLTITFNADGKVHGSASCNLYFGNFELSGEGIKFSPAGSTMMACPEALMQQERKFLNTLEKITQFSISPEGALILRGADDAYLKGFPLE